MPSLDQGQTHLAAAFAPSYASASSLVNDWLIDFIENDT